MADRAMAEFPLPPGSTVGVLGGGQLGRMLALAAARLGLRTAVLDPDADCPAAAIADVAIAAGYDDLEGLKALAKASDVVTFEFENVPAETVQQLVDLGAAVAPSARALAVAQDRVDEKTFLNLAGAPTVEPGGSGNSAIARSAIARGPRPFAVALMVRMAPESGGV